MVVASFSIFKLYDLFCANPGIAAFTEELLTEGYQREMISKLQNMRKDADFEVSDRIVVTYECKDKLADAIEAGRDFIMSSVLATSMERTAAPEGVEAKEWDLNGKKITISIRKA